MTRFDLYSFYKNMRKKINRQSCMDHPAQKLYRCMVSINILICNQIWAHGTIAVFNSAHKMIQVCILLFVILQVRLWLARIIILCENVL